MALLTLTNAHLAFGHVALLDGADFALETAERVALIGRNGTGKSSMLKILAGMDKPDDGLLQVERGLRRVYVPQEPLFAQGITVFDAVSEGVAEAKEAREKFENHDGVDHDEMDRLQTRIEALASGWDWERRVDDETLHRLGSLERPRCWSSSCPVACASASRWRRRWWPRPTCCCSTSPPTTWIWTPSTGSPTCSRPTAAR